MLLYLQGGKIRDLLFQILEQEEDVIIKQGAQSRESQLMASRYGAQSKTSSNMAKPGFKMRCLYVHLATIYVSQQ